MERWLGLDSKFYKWGTLLADLIILTVLWLICSLPIITIGASTTALYYVTTRQLSNREGYVSRDFFRSFRKNFLQATLVEIILGIMTAALFINILMLDRSTVLGSILYPIQFVILYELSIVTIYIYPILSRFEFKTIQLFKTAFFMANRHLMTTITCFVLFIAAILIIFKCYILIFVCAGFYAILTSLMFMSLFRKYIPEMDKDDFADMR